MTRLISATASEILQMNKQQLFDSIRASEGRVICSENMVIYKPVCDVLTNAEIDRAFGADMILLNFLDVTAPFIAGLNTQDDSYPDWSPDFDSVKKLREYVGRPVGLNLEPVNINANMMDSRNEINGGRIVTKENLIRAAELGCDFVCLTGNPKTGVDNQSLVSAVQLAKENFPGLILAGKMHSAGVNEDIVNLDLVKQFIDHGADVVLAPAVGTVPGFTDKQMKEIVDYAHRNNTLVMSTIGTSQEGSTKHVIEEIALRNKICGVDIQHIGDVSQKENIFAMSMAIRGQRHTYNRMAQSVRR